MLRPPTRATRPRLASESGFTLVELLLVLVIIGILLAFAVPSLRGFRDRAQQSAAASNIRTALPAVLAYYADNATYAGMSVAELRKIDAGLELDPVVPMMQTTTSYCIAGTVGTKTWKNSNADHVSAVAGACLPRPRSRASPVAGRRSA